jgi:hypothetical protein
MIRYICQGIWQDGNGRVVDDGNVTVYLAGTTTLATIYADKTTVTPVTGSVVQSGTDGHWSFYIDTTDYGYGQLFKIVLSKACYTSKTYDDYPVIFQPFDLLSNYSNDFATAIASIGSDSQTLYIDVTPNALTASVTVPATLNLVWLKGFVLTLGSYNLTVNGTLQAGAYQLFNLNSTGIADLSGMKGEANAFWAGLDFVDIVACKPKVIYIPPYKAFADYPAYATGDLYVSAECAMDDNKVREVYGDGHNSILFSRIADGSNILTWDTSGTYSKYLTLRSFGIRGNNYADGNAITITPTASTFYHLRITDLWIYNNGGHGIVLGDSVTPNDAYNCVIEKSWFGKAVNQDGKADIYLDETGPHIVIKENFFWSDGGSDGVTRYGIYLADTSQIVSIFDNTFGNNLTDMIGIYLSDVAKGPVQIHHNYFEELAVGIDLRQSNNSSVTENSFYNNTQAIRVASGNRSLTLGGNTYSKALLSTGKYIELYGTQDDYRSYVHTYGQDATITPTYDGSTAGRKTKDYTNDTAFPIMNQQVWDTRTSDTIALQRFQGVAEYALTDDTMVDIINIAGHAGADSRLYHGVLSGTITLTVMGNYYDAPNSNVVMRCETYNVLIYKYKTDVIKGVFTSSGAAEIDAGGKTPTFTIDIKAGVSATVGVVEAKCTFTNWEIARMTVAYDLVQQASYALDMMWPTLP